MNCAVMRMPTVCLISARGMLEARRSWARWCICGSPHYQPPTSASLRLELPWSHFLAGFGSGTVAKNHCSVNRYDPASHKPQAY